MRRWLRQTDVVEPKYPKRVGPSVIDDWAAQVTGWLRADSRRPKRDRRTARFMFEAIRAEGYTPDRKGIHPQQHLESFNGTLQADAYSGYQAISETGRGAEPLAGPMAARRVSEKLWQFLQMRCHFPQIQARRMWIKYSSR